MRKVGSILLGIMAVLAAGVLMGLWLRGDGLVTSEPVAEAGARPGAAPARRTMLVPGESEGMQESGPTEVPTVEASRTAFAADRSTLDYAKSIREEILENPPPLRSRDDSAVTGDEAFRLYLFYRMCATSQRSAWQTDRYLGYLEDQLPEASPQQLDRMDELSESLLDSYDRCKIIPLDVDCYREAVLWLGVAVRRGHPVAPIIYYNAALTLIGTYRSASRSPWPAFQHPGLIDEFRTTALLALERASTTAHPEALLAMSQAVLDGLIYAREPKLAYAYAYAASISPGIPDSIHKFAQERMLIAAQFISPEEESEAADLALELLQAHSD